MMTQIMKLYLYNYCSDALLYDHSSTSTSSPVDTVFNPPFSIISDSICIASSESFKTQERSFQEDMSLSMSSVEEQYLPSSELCDLLGVDSKSLVITLIRMSNLDTIEMINKSIHFITITAML